MPVPKIPNWSSLDHVGRARAMLEWCDDHVIDTASILERNLMAAIVTWEASMVEERREMGEEYEFSASPMDYLHMIRSIAAFLRSRI